MSQNSHLAYLVPFPGKFSMVLLKNQICPAFPPDPRSISPDGGVSTIYSTQPSQHTQSNFIWWAVACCGFHIYRRIDVKLQFSELTKLIEGSTVLKQSNK